LKAAVEHAIVDLGLTDSMAYDSPTVPRRQPVVADHAAVDTLCIDPAAQLSLAGIDLPAAATEAARASHRNAA